MVNQPAAIDSAESPAEDGAEESAASQGSDPDGARDSRTDDLDRSAGIARSDRARGGTSDEDVDDSQGEGDVYAIAGQVVDESGRPVDGLGVVAVLSRLFDEEAADEFPYGPVEQRTQTGTDGYFDFYGLPDGEYQIRTIASARYPAVASTLSRAGQDSVKLVVAYQHEVSVRGIVESSLGLPLAGAEVVPVSQQERWVATGQNGDYRVQLTMKRSSSYALRFWAEGYREQTLRVSASEIDATGSIVRDVVLEPERELTVVAGTVTSNDSAVVGERVYLKSSQTRNKYSAVTDPSGSFMIDGVEVGGDYILWISPQGPYRRFRENNVEVPTEGLDLDIALEAEDVGSLTGRMIDLDGNPVGNFSLFLSSQGSTQSPLPVTGDSGGYFNVDNVPEGLLSIRTSSLPKFSVTGIKLSAGEDKQVELILDVGDYALQGQVLDQRGNPIPAANVIMSWVYREGGVTHESLHKTVSSADGRFEFNALGPGERTVTVAAPGFETVKLEHDVGGADDFGQPLQVQLEDESS
jgi:hypothetical protein